MWSRTPLYSFSPTLRHSHRLQTLAWVAYVYFSPLLTSCIRMQFNWYWPCSTQVISSVNKLMKNIIFRCVHIVAKNPYYLCHECPLTIPVRMSASINAAPMGRISMKFDICNLYENLSRKSKLIKIRQNYRTLYMKTWVRFIVIGAIKSS
jgi:hypothetical protein